MSETKPIKNREEQLTIVKMDVLEGKGDHRGTIEKIYLVSENITISFKPRVKETVTSEVDGLMLKREEKRNARPFEVSKKFKAIRTIIDKFSQCSIKTSYNSFTADNGETYHYLLDGDVDSLLIVKPKPDEKSKESLDIEMIDVEDL